MEKKNALRDQVTQCSGSQTFSPVSATITNDVPPYKSKELWIACAHNIACVYCHTCTYSFPKQNDDIFPKCQYKEIKS